MDQEYGFMPPAYKKYGMRNAQPQSAKPALQTMGFEPKILSIIKNKP
jgi:hypothetical protein